MIFVVILLSVFLLDLLLKKYVEAKLGEGEEYSLAGGRILVHKLHNDGLAFGLLADRPRLIQRMNLGLLAGTFVYFVWLLCHPGEKAKKAGVSLVLGGGLCNWFDRFHQGFVTDYFSFSCRWQKLKRVVFNLSDICIFVGSLLYLFSGIFGKRGRRRA